LIFLWWCRKGDREKKRSVAGKRERNIAKRERATPQAPLRGNGPCIGLVIEGGGNSLLPRERQNQEKEGNGASLSRGGKK